MFIDARLSIAIAEAKRYINENEKLEDRIRKAMEITKNHWMVTNDNDRFVSAISAVYLVSNDDERKRIIKELDQIKILNSALSGVPINWELVSVLEDPIGLMKMWNEVKEK